MNIPIKRTQTYVMKYILPFKGMTWKQADTPLCKKKFSVDAAFNTLLLINNDYDGKVIEIKI
jgi:hypothetical protein